MNRRTLTWGAGALVLLGIILWYWMRSEMMPASSPSVVPSKPRKTPNQSPSPLGANPVAATISQQQIKGAIENERTYEKKVWSMGFATPIRFYGKVIDENGNPIAGAQARVSMHDRGVGNTKVEKVTDANGLFSVSGHGLGLGVMTSKPGYYHLPESDGSFGYAQGAGTGSPHPDSAKPALFVLKKMGQAETLFTFQSDFKILKNGTPFSVDLSTGRRSTNNTNEGLIIEAWTQDSNSRPYDWRCRISSPGGGLLERKGNFDFVAPEDGYQPSIEINMPASTGTEWRSQVTKNYFVKLGNGDYARIDFTMTTGGDHFFSITSYLNPRPGSRNLEYDAAKTAQTR